MTILVGIGCLIAGLFLGYRVGCGITRIHCAAIIDALEASVKSGKPEGVLAE